MEQYAVEETVREFISNQAGCSAYKTPADTLESLGIDSLDKLEITMEIEDEFGIDISIPELEDLTTVQDILNIIEEKT